VPSHTPHRLEARRAARRQRDRNLRRRQILAVLAAAGAVAAVGLVAAVVVIAVIGSTSSSDDGPLASPVPSAELGTGRRPPDVVIARAAEVPLRLPVDPDRISAVAYHPVSDTTLVAMEPGDGVSHVQSPRDGRSGPDTAAVDVGAPAGTAVYSPVDGVIAAVTDYRVSGEVEGYEVAIEPDVAAGQLVVRVSHLDPHDGKRPQVGDTVTAGQSIIGLVRDFSGVADQELSQFTSDSGNHVAIEVVRTGADLIP
jgi:murein DD-endopeptidase MepM/ murein hydrolase activator NlpD